jgi:hypothetical protein
MGSAGRKQNTQMAYRSIHDTGSTGYRSSIGGSALSYRRDTTGIDQRQSQPPPAGTEPTGSLSTVRPWSRLGVTWQHRRIIATNRYSQCPRRNIDTSLEYPRVLDEIKKTHPEDGWA